MIFNFFLGNHPPERLKKLPDLLRPIQHGLAEAGHRVIGYGLTLLPAPAVNILVEFFPDDEFVDKLLAMKSQGCDNLVIGLLCADDIEDGEALELAQFPRRRPNLRRLLPAADFVWTLLPRLPVYDSICGPGKTALVELGFSERLVNRHLIQELGLRDIDIVIDGAETPRRREIVAAFKGQGLKCFISGATPLPNFATSDLVRRAKVLVDARRSPATAFVSPRRICKGLHNGTLVITEAAGGVSGGGIERYSLVCAPEHLVERCVATVRSGLAAELGLAALSRFRVETSMRDNMRRILQTPLFTRLTT